MVLSDICIRRPVFSTVLSLIIVLIGAVSYSRLSVREYPKIDEPVVTVSVNYLGASADIIETQVTKPLEDSIAGIEGVDVLTSISRAERSQISVRFRLDREPDGAAADVRDRVARVRGKLPQAIDEPVIAKVEADANPIIWMAFSSDNRNALDVSDIANRVVKPRLQTLPGAADVRIFGERKYAMRVWLDPDRLAAFRLTPNDIEDALRRQNVEVPSGRIESQQREFTVVSQTDLQRVVDFENVVIRTVNAYPVRLKDVARVALGAENERTSVRFNGRAAISLGLIKQATANPLVLATALKAELPNIQKDLPPGVTVDIANDSTLFISRSINSVYETIGEAVILVALVIFVFLGTVRASVIPLVTIPVSPDRRVRADAAGRILDEHAHAARAGAGDRPGGGRCDRGAGEHLPSHRRRHGADGGRVSRHQGGRLRGDRDDAHAGGGVRANRLHDRAHRQALRRIRAHARRRGAGVGVRRAHALADDVRAAAASRSEAEHHGARCRSGSRRVDPRLYGGLALRAAPALDRDGGVRRRGRRQLFPVDRNEARARADRGSGHDRERVQQPGGCVVRLHAKIRAWPGEYLFAESRKPIACLSWPATRP